MNDLLTLSSPIWTALLRDEEKTTRLTKAPADVFHQDGRVTFKIDLPGVEKDNIEISTDKDTLALKAKRELNNENEPESSIMIRERFEGMYARRFKLPFMIDSTQTTASFNNGVLEITCYAHEAEKPKKIAIA